MKSHLTLCFFGRLETAQIPQLIHLLSSTHLAQKKFSVQITRLGAFPDAHSARILWAGFDAASEELLRELSQQICSISVSIGINPDDRLFQPHVTLGRFKRPRSFSCCDLEGPIVLDIDRLAFFRSMETSLETLSVLPLSP